MGAARWGGPTAALAGRSSPCRSYREASPSACPIVHPHPPQDRRTSPEPPNRPSCPLEGAVGPPTGGWPFAGAPRVDRAGIPEPALATIQNLAIR